MWRHGWNHSPTPSLRAATFHPRFTSPTPLFDATFRRDAQWAASDSHLRHTSILQRPVDLELGRLAENNRKANLKRPVMVLVLSYANDVME
jgi:hypothetical protein